MTTELNLPPVYDPVVLDSGAEGARAHACRVAAAGADAGLFVWWPASDRIECAIVLRPEEEVAGVMPIVLVASLALLDALGAVGPAAVACDLVWPATVRINGGAVGGIALDLPGNGNNPEWAVVTAVLRKTGKAGTEAGERPDLAALADEGFAGVADKDLLEAFARYLLVWMDRWQEGGLAAIAPHWLQRAKSSGGEAVIAVGGALVAGGINGLDDSGGLLLETPNGLRLLDLEPGLLSLDPALP